MNTGAVFSPCRQYRYALFRRWADPGVPAVFIMLNPSTADEVVNDPTVERCERRARAMGFGALRVCNLFALRSTDPRALYDHADPVGQSNDATIMELVQGAGIVICAWGKHGNLHDRGRIVHKTLLMNGVVPHYLKLNKDGTPAHPLYIPYETLPQRWEA
ncbi:MAG: DUF1643 domain-containing protein [Burkholderiaceae bacterium]|nr:DUF1643 domain-containing protein [Burkholderiaceae bacterium]